MMNISNSQYSKMKTEDLFVCVIGYEPRSYYLLQENLETRNSTNTLIFKLDDDKLEQKLKNEIEDSDLKIVDCEYNNTNKFKQEVIVFFQENLQKHKRISLCVDYSSMPTSWYCSVPIFLKDYINERSKITFFYTAGSYPNKYENYPTAGIDSISVFSGITLPAVDIKRYHIMGLGYDKIRTETVKSIIEPDLLIICYAYNPDDDSIRSNIYNLNKNIIEGSLLSVALPINNFCGMVDKISEIVYEQLRDGQVVLIPDGPKPLIMAMSLISDLIKRDGVTCLHISRNSSHFSKIHVTPRVNDIFCFQVN